MLNEKVKYNELKDNNGASSNNRRSVLFMKIKGKQA